MLFIGLFRCCYFESALVHLLAALNFANVFKNKNVWKIKNVKNVINVTKIKKRKNVFTARCYASAVLAMALFCLSVRPSQVGVLLKRLNVGSHK